MGYAFINFKKAFLWFLLFKTILVQNLTFLSLPGLPLLTIDTFMNLFFCAFFYVNRKKYIKLMTEKFPMKIPFLLLAGSWFISTIYAIAGFANAFSMFIGNVIQLLLVWIMWVLIKDKRDIIFLIKGLTLLFVCYALYMFYECSIQSNPFAEYTGTFISSDRLIDFSYEVTTERGYRARSVFEHAIGAGCNFALVGVLIFTILYAYNVKLPHLHWYLCVGILCSFCVFMTGSRGPIVFIMLAYLGFVNFKNLKFYRFAVIGVLAFLIALPYLPSTVFNITMSIFDSDYQAQVGGSDADMRFDQLAAAIAVMGESPIVGLGYKFNSVMNTHLIDYLLGMESMWFSILTSFGLIGLFVNLIVAYYFLIKIPRQYHSQPFFFLSLAYWVTATLTSLPGLQMFLYYLVLVIFIKIAQFKRNSLLIIHDV